MQKQKSPEELKKAIEALRPEFEAICKDRGFIPDQIIFNSMKSYCRYAKEEALRKS